MGVCSFNAGARDATRARHPTKCICKRGMPISSEAAFEIEEEKAYIMAARNNYYSPPSGRRWKDVDSLDQFLTAYRMSRVLPSQPMRRRKLVSLLQSVPQFLLKIEETKLEDQNFEDTSTRDTVRRLYELVNSSLRTRRIRENATAVGKVLHILQPEFFVIWDNRIRQPRQFDGSFEGYWDYLRTAQRGIVEALDDFKRISKNPNATSRSIEAELYENHVKPITKVYDEACWAMVQGWLHFY